MSLLELISAGEERPDFVRIPNRLITRLLTTYRSEDGESCEIDFLTLEKVYTLAAEKRRQGKSRIVVYDHAQVFVDGRRVDKLTPFQVAVIEYVVTAGSVSIETLIDNVWRNPDLSRKSVLNFFYRLNRFLEGHSCEMVVSSGIVKIDFF